MRSLIASASLFAVAEGLGPSTDMTTDDRITWKVATLATQSCQDVCQAQASRLHCNARAAETPFYDKSTLACGFAETTGNMDCTQVGDVNKLRICPCGESWPEWMLATEGTSCKRFCDDLGGDSNCNQDTAQLKALVDASKITAIMDTLGVTCVGAATAGAASQAPLVDAAGACNFLGDTPVLGSDAAFPGAKRLCQCFDRGDTHSPSVPSPVAVRCRSAAEFIKGEGIGGVKTLVGTANTQAECRNLVLNNCASANAATYVMETRSCYCEAGIMSVQATPGVHTCWFPDDSRLFSTGLANSSTSPLAVALVAVTALLALVGVSLRRVAAKSDEDPTLLVE